MAELLLELYSEEIPPQLQIGARNQLKNFFEKYFKDENIEYKEMSIYSCPTRLALAIENLDEKIKIESREIKGPKVGSPDIILQGFMKAKDISKNNLVEKNTDKGKFYFIKTEPKIILVEELLISILPKALTSISWKKSMKWSDHNLMWGRPLISIFAVFNGKKINFKFDHIISSDEIIIEQDLTLKNKKVKNYIDDRKPKKESLKNLKVTVLYINHDYETRDGLSSSLVKLWEDLFKYIGVENYEIVKQLDIQ